MQLTLAFLEPPTPTPSPPSRELRDAEARAQAIDILARLIAQTALRHQEREKNHE